MTDGLGRRARWTAALVAAPGAAAVFGAAVSWAADTVPATSAKSEGSAAVVASTPAPTVNPRETKLRSDAAANKRKAAQLRKDLTRLQAKLKQMQAASAAGAAGGSAGGSGGGYSGGGYSGGSTSGGGGGGGSVSGPAPAAPAPAAPAPAAAPPPPPPPPPPPAQTGTGASGA